MRHQTFTQYSYPENFLQFTTERLKHNKSINLSNSCKGHKLFYVSTKMTQDLVAHLMKNNMSNRNPFLTGIILH